MSRTEAGNHGNAFSAMIARNSPTISSLSVTYTLPSDPAKAETVERVGNIRVGLRDPDRVLLFRLRYDEIEGHRKHQFTGSAIIFDSE